MDADVQAGSDVVVTNDHLPEQTGPTERLAALNIGVGAHQPESNTATSTWPSILSWTDGQQLDDHWSLPSLPPSASPQLTLSETYHLVPSPWSIFPNLSPSPRFSHTEQVGAADGASRAGPGRHVSASGAADGNSRASQATSGTSPLVSDHARGVNPPSTTTSPATLATPRTGSAHERCDPASLHGLVRHVIDVPFVNVLVQSFFKEIHPYWPILHRPSFDIKLVSEPLLGAMLMLASWITKRQEHLQLAPVVFEAVLEATEPVGRTLIRATVLKMEVVNLSLRTRSHPSTLCRLCCYASCMLFAVG